MLRLTMQLFMPRSTSLTSRGSCQYDLARELYRRCIFHQHSCSPISDLSKCRSDPTCSPYCTWGIYSTGFSWDNWGRSWHIRCWSWVHNPRHRFCIGNCIFIYSGVVRRYLRRVSAFGRKLGILSLSISGSLGWRIDHWQRWRESSRMYIVCFCRCSLGGWVCNRW